MLLRSTLRRLLLAGGALTALHPGAVRAQAVNYGALEELFGQPVTTSVTGKPQLASQVPGDLVIITHDQIRQSGATDIPSILQFVTGIDVRHTPSATPKSAFAATIHRSTRGCWCWWTVARSISMITVM